MPNVQQAKLKTLVREKIAGSGMSVKEVAQKARLSASTLYNWFNGSDEIGELAIGKLSKILGPEIEQLFYNTGHEPSKTNTQSESEEERARKNYALREIERIGDGISDLGEQEKFWDVVLATSRAFGDASSRGAKAKRGDGGVKGSSVRGGGSDFGESAANVAKETNTGL